VSAYRGAMDVEQLLERVSENVTVRRVFGEPIHHGDILIIPVARVRGGAGGGSGSGPGDEGSGSGGGGGFEAVPAGVYVVENDAVAWRPAVDVTRVVAGAQLVAIVLALVVRSIVRHR
jgi:uncharacterized spore protein YtfJ